MAITVTVDDQHAVAGFLSPGDSVNVVAYGTIKDPSSTSGPGAKTAAFLLPGLKVVAVGNQTTHATSTASATSASNASSATSASRSLVTFEVTPRQALQLVQAEATMAIYLTLNPPSFKPGDFKDPGEVVEALNLFDRPLPLVQSALDQVKAAQGK